MREFFLESMDDTAYVMNHRKGLKKLHITMLSTGIPLAVLQWLSIILWITKGNWWLLAVWAFLAVPYGICISRWYLMNVAYLCPQCHQLFRLTFRKAFFTMHTSVARKLTCPACGHHGFCVEIAAGSEVNGDE